MTDIELRVTALRQAMGISRDTDEILVAAEKIYQWLVGKPGDFKDFYPNLETYRILTGKPK